MKFFLFRILRKLGILHFLKLKPSIKIGGKRFILPRVEPDQIQMLSLSQHEPWLQNLLQLLLPDRDGIFIDVGVNSGQTLLKVKAICENQSYMGFEPNPACNAYVDELIRLNRLTNCVLMPVGLAKRTEIVTLFIDNPTSAIGSTIDGFRPNSFYNITQQVAVFNGDILLSEQGIDNISVVKIDVEGGEPEVLQGLRETISDSKPVILMEILPVIEPNPENDSEELRNFRQQREDQMIDLLKIMGYTMFRQMHTGELIQIDSIKTHSDLSLCEYVFIHNDDTQAWERLGCSHQQPAREQY